MLASRRSLIIMNLSKDVFERRTSTGSGLFSFLDSGFAHLLGQLVSIIAKTLRNTNLGASRCFKMKKTSVPVDVRRSKTPLLKLPNNEGVPQIKPYVTSQKLLDSPSTFNAQKPTMTPRLSGHISMFGLVFFLFKSLLGMRDNGVVVNFQFCP